LQNTDSQGPALTTPVQSKSLWLFSALKFKPLPLPSFHPAGGVVASCTGNEIWSASPDLFKLNEKEFL